jgi:hypothetical protein
LQFPLTQNVEFFLPARPIIEVGESNLAKTDSGIPVFCEQGGLVNITGYPNAVQSVSTGVFELQTLGGIAILPSVAVPIPSLDVHGFVDNGNGTASIDPVNLSVYLDANGLSALKFQQMRLVYTYHLNAAPLNTKSQGTRVIRVSPNPEALFSQSLLCEDIDIQFTDMSPAITATGVSITRWDWNFGDANSASNTSTVRNPTHRYEDAGLYLNVE